MCNLRKNFLEKIVTKTYLNIIYKNIIIIFGGFIMTDVSAGVEYKINVDGNSFLLGQ